MSKGLVCPIQCGQCCEYWVEALECEPTFFRDVDLDLDKLPFDCPHQGPDGCVLPRSDRPNCCREYLCDKAEVVLARRNRRKAAARRNCG